MRNKRFWGALTACVALVVAAGTGALLAVTPAAATGKTVTCTSLAGNLNTDNATFTLGGCTGNTGGSGTAQGTTIRWHNGLATYLLTSAFTPSGPPKRGKCGALANKWTVTDRVGGDNTGSIKVGGKVTAKVCILNQSPDPWSLAPNTVFRLS